MNGPGKTVNWENETRRILRAELVRRGITYAMLARRLQSIGIRETERSIANKMSRGTFSFAFFLQCMSALGVQTLHIQIPTQSRQSGSVLSRAASD